MTKLIRDQLALDIMKHSPEKIGMIEGLDMKEKALHNKIIEETLELADELDRAISDKDKIIEEAGDIIEVVYAICDFHDIDIMEVHKMQEAKRKIKGGFVTFSCLINN